MDIQEKLMDDLKEAMRSGDVQRRDVIRYLRAGIKNAEVERNAPLSEADVYGVIQKQINQRKDSIEAFQKAGRQDLVDKEQGELAILQSYMPQQMTREEIESAARQVIAEVGAQGPRDIGKVMPKLMAQLKGKAEGREISAVVSELLSQG